MNRAPRLRRSLALWLALSALAVVPAWAGDGFGTLTKDFAVVNRAHPPRVFLTGTRIAVKASGQTAALKPAAEKLRTLLESELLSADSRLTVDEKSPQTLVEVTVVEDTGKNTWGTRMMVERVDTGREDAKGKPIYHDEKTPQKYETVTHTLSVAFKARDVRTKANLDADSFTKKFSQEYVDGDGAPELETVETSAINEVVDQIRTRLTPTIEKLPVLLPRGSLKDLNNLATAGLWNQYMEALESLPQRPKTDDESYRQYALGLAYEALGYAAETPDDTLRYLQQASAYYNQALQANPGEKYFSQPFSRHSFSVGKLLKPSQLFHKSESAIEESADSAKISSDDVPPPLERVKAALVDYQRIKDFPSGAGGGTGKSAQADAKTKKDAGKADDVLDNDDVIEMVKAGLPEPVILTAIDSAASHQFDVTAKGLIQLGKARVSKTIIEHIQSRASRP